MQRELATCGHNGSKVQLWASHRLTDGQQGSLPPPEKLVEQGRLQTLRHLPNVKIALMQLAACSLKPGLLLR